MKTLNTRMMSLLLSLMMIFGIILCDGGQNVLAVTAPAVPTGLTAVSASYNSIKIAWTAVPEATGYEVYRSTTAASGFVKISTAAATSYTNSGLTTGTTYYYKVKSYMTVDTATVRSAATLAVSAKPILGVPTSLKVTPTTGSALKISWTAVSGASGYLVYRSALATSGFTQIASTSAAAYTNTGLTAGSAYYYKVKAFITIGTSNICSSATAAVSGVPIPDAPANAKAVSAGYNSIKISWSAVTGASGYSVLRSASSTGTYTIVKNTTALAFTDTGRTTGTTYYYKIKAYKTVGTTKVYSKESTAVSAKPIPSIPTNLAAVSAGSSSIRLSWTAVTGATSYVVYRSTAASSGFVQIATSATPSFTNSSLSTGTTYYFKVKACTTVGVTNIYSGVTGSVGATPASVGSGTRTSPYSGFEKRTLTFQEYSWYEPKTISIQLLQVITGQSANTLVNNENMFNQVPAADEEWIVLKYHMKYISGTDEALYAYEVLSPGNDFYTNTFTAINPLDTAAFSNELDGLGAYEVNMYPGGESDVYYGILVKKTVGYPMYRIATGYDESTYNTIYTWFSTNPSY